MKSSDLKTETTRDVIQLKSKRWEKNRLFLSKNYSHLQLNKHEWSQPCAFQFGQRGAIFTPREWKRPVLHNIRDLHVCRALDWPHWIKWVSGLIGLQAPLTPRGHVRSDTHIWLLPADFCTVRVLFFSTALSVNGLKAKKKTNPDVGVICVASWQDQIGLSL